MAPRAVVLFSGGVDSTTTVGFAIKDGFTPVLLSLDYGQKHRIELEKSKLVALQFGNLEHLILSVNLSALGGSALTSSLDVPKDRTLDDSIPVTYVPARNLIFLSIACAVGEVRGASTLYFGANILDYSGYPDCRPEFIQSLEETMNLGTRSGTGGNRFKICAPLLALTKGEIIRAGLQLGIDYANTHSCYDPSPEGVICGSCDSCRIRKKGFEEAGITDPAV